MKKITFLIFALLGMSLTWNVDAQVLNEAANWPNASWILTGTYDTDPLAFESDPTSTSSFAFDDDDAGSGGQDDDIAAESPVIDLTAAHTAGETWITVSADYFFRVVNALGAAQDDLLAIQYWDADATSWMEWSGAIEGTEGSGGATTNNFCAPGKTAYVTPPLNIVSFSSTQLSGFKYRIYYDDDGLIPTGNSWEYGFCFDSPTIISETPPSCPDPTGLTASNITDTTVLLGWVESGSATAWNIEVGIPGFTPGTGSSTSSLTGWMANPETISGLTPQTTYEFYVQADCGGDGNSSWVGPLTFTTGCSPVNNFSENFDSVSTPDLPICWSYVIDNGASTFATVGTSTTYSNSSPNSVNLYNSDSSASSNIILVSPVVSNLADGTHQLRFFARNTTSSQDIEVGTISDPNDGSTFTSLETVDITTTFTEYTVSFSSYSGSDNYIAVRRLSTSTYTNVYLDDIVWEVAPTDTLDYYNVQWPPSGTIVAGESYVVYAQCWEGGLTDASSSPAAGIEVWIGYSTTDTDPSTGGWTWVAATPNPGYDFTNNNDEYQLDLGANISTSGTFYYASRWRLNGGPYTYGGINGSGNGDWATYGSGVLTVNPPANDDCSGAIALTPGVVYNDNPIDGTVVGAISDTETNSCGLNGPGIWYSVLVPNDGNITIETGPDAGTGNTAFDSVIEAFSGSCGSLVSIGCDDDGAATGNYSLLELIGLVPGETIYLRVWEYNGDETEPFSISAYSGTLSSGNSNIESLFSYYPNPVNNSLTLNAQKTIENVSVVNMLGQEVMNVSPNSVNDELDMSNLSNGSYFVRVTVEGITETVRIVKQ